MNNDTKMDIQAIKDSLDKIVELLIGISRMTHQPFYYYGSPGFVYDPNSPGITVELPADNGTAKLCNCGDHKHGEGTGGWYCPVHGQCY